MDEPVLVSGTDGVGTKLKVAQLVGKHDTVGIDLVAMCANDILVTGAEPLFFLDYIAIGALEPNLVKAIVAGIAEGCRQAGCALVGGEMAEHPGVMPADDYDLSGFCVGVVDRPKMLDPANVQTGDVVLGLASSGLHSNGFSLVRSVLVEGHESELGLPRVDFGGATLGDVLLTPTRIYVRQALDVLRGEHGSGIRAMAHITGGGITENLNRALPETCDAVVHTDAWRIPRIFDVLADAAGLPDEEMLTTFNMGIGMALIVEPSVAPKVACALRLAGETVCEMGEIVPGDGRVRYA
jgi:phosphoribosylformylglycinamidine cyclo-ligase